MPSTTVEIKGKDKTSAAFNAVNRSIGKLKTGVLAIGAAVAGASAAFGLWFNKMRDEADRIGKVANQINITAESLQKLQFAAGQGGVSLGKFDKGLQKFSESIGKSLAGSKAQAEAFQRLGVDIKDTEGNTKALDKIFLEVAHGAMLLKDELSLTATMTKLFGGAGAELLPMLKSGSEAITLLGERLSLVGGVISNEGVPATEEFNDNLDLISRKFKEKFTPIIQMANSAIKQFTEEERLATMTLPQMRDHLQEQIDKLAKTRAELDTLNPKQKLFGQILAKVGLGANLTKEAIQEQINSLVKNRKEIDKQILASVKLLEIERKALIEKNNEIDANGLLAKANQVVTDSTYELNDAILSQNNLYTGQINTIEELMIKKQESLEADMLFHQEEMAMLEEFDAEYKKKSFDRAVQDSKDAERKKKLEEESLKSALGTIESLANGVKDSSIEMFRLWQAAAIANATISTLEAATKALTAGPFLGPILAGVIYGLGMANVAKIASTNYQGRYLGGDISSNKAYIVGERGPEIFNPGRTGSITPNRNSEQGVIINIYDGTGRKISQAMSDLRVEVVERANSFGQFAALESPLYTDAAPA